MELAVEDPESYRNRLHMPKKHFNILLNCVMLYIQKLNTYCNERFYTAQTEASNNIEIFGSGDSFATLQYLYRIPKCTISKFLPDVCDSISLALLRFQIHKKNGKKS